MVNIFPSASLNPCRKRQVMNKLKQIKHIDSSDKLSQTLSFIHLFNKHVSTGYMPSIFLSILFCNSESSSEKSIQENARITEPSWLILFTHRDQVICGVYRLKKKKGKTKSFTRYSWELTPSPNKLFQRELKIYPAKVNLKRNKPLGVAKMK